MERVAQRSGEEGDVAVLSRAGRPGARRLRRPGGARSRRQRGRAASPQLAEVVRGGDEPPFRATGRETSALEAVAATVDLGVREDRLDHRLAPAIELSGFLAGEHLAHLLIERSAAGPCWALA